jgi:AraC-like DNA-binding protein
MDETHYARIDELRQQLADDLAQADKTRQRLHEAIADAFPEVHGEPAKRGVLAEVSRRSGYSREHVAQLRTARLNAK